MTFFSVLKRFGPPVLVMAAITLASAQPGTSLPSIQFQFSDKLVHAAVFAVLGAAWLHALGWRTSAPFVAVGICTVFGVLDELHQSTVPNRFPDFFDGLADTVGAILGVACFSVLRRRQARSKETDVND